MSDKASKDKAIFDRLMSLDYFRDASTVLCYVSLKEEAATDAIINSALELGKTVAVPYCINKFGEMDFYIINSLSDLKTGTFNVREPDINKNKRLEDFEKSIIIVPGVAFSHSGQRLGYGGGYYDRFLSAYEYTKVGLCYDVQLCDAFVSEAYDKPVDIIVTETQVIYTHGGENGF